MSRVRTAAYYERRRVLAAAREAYYLNRPPNTSTTVNSRGATTSLYYHSLLIRSGTDPAAFSVNVLNSTLALVSAANAGLSATLPNTEFPQRLRGSGMKPTTAHWFKGDTTPAAVPTPWGSRWIRYYDTGGSQSHRSIPLSKVTGAFDANDIKTAFTNIFNGADRTTLLGTENGRAWLEFESAPVATQT